MLAAYGTVQQYSMRPTSLPSTAYYTGLVHRPLQYSTVCIVQQILVCQSRQMLQWRQPKTGASSRQKGPVGAARMRLGPGRCGDILGWAVLGWFRSYGSPRYARCSQTSVRGSRPRNSRLQRSPFANGSGASALWPLIPLSSKLLAKKWFTQAAGCSVQNHTPTYCIS